MDLIVSQFNERFKTWDLELPRLSVAGRTSGILKNGLWDILFVFGENGQGEFLDYFAYCRFKGYEHVRIHEDGRCEDLPTFWEFTYESREATKKHNAHVSKLLRAKGLDETRIKFGADLLHLTEFDPSALAEYDGTQIVMTNDIVLFWKPPAIFSQWSRNCFEVDSEIFLSAEQFMMAEKARLFGDNESRRKIMATSDPSEHQALGRRIAGFDARAWEANRLQVVTRGNLAKFSQDPARKLALLETGDRLLAEAIPSDRLWGIGYDPTRKEAYDPSRWGQNLLGQALMDVRHQIRQGNETE